MFIITIVIIGINTSNGNDTKSKINNNDKNNTANTSIVVTTVTTIQQ